MDEFLEAVSVSGDSLARAGQILVRAVESDPLAKDKLMERHPCLTLDLIEVFEKIGRRQLYHRCCMSNRPGISALRACNYSDQVRFFEEPIPLLLVNGKDDTDHILVSAHTMNSDQVRQVFRKGHIRTLGEQRAYIESQKPKPVQVVSNSYYTVLRKGRVKIHGACTLDAQELLRLAAEAVASR